MGYGLPATVGRAWLRVKKRCVCISGDGGMLFNLQELQTVIHHNLPMNILIDNSVSYSEINDG